jgi:hypothetical protein
MEKIGIETVELLRSLPAKPSWYAFESFPPVVGLMKDGCKEESQIKVHHYHVLHHVLLSAASPHRSLHEHPASSFRFFMPKI